MRGHGLNRKWEKQPGQKEIYKYEEAMQARIGGDTVRKVLAIRNRLNDV